MFPLAACWSVVLVGAAVEVGALGVPPIAFCEGAAKFGMFLAKLGMLLSGGGV